MLLQSVYVHHRLLFYFPWNEPWRADLRTVKADKVFEIATAVARGGTEALNVSLFQEPWQRQSGLPTSPGTRLGPQKAT